MNFKIQPYDLLILSLTFICFTIIGTLTHELGHIAVAKMLGYETSLHYSSMNWDHRSIYEELTYTHTKYLDEIENNLAFPGKLEFEASVQHLRKSYLWIAMGGPIQTMLTGIIGLLMLLYRRPYIRTNGLKLTDWLAIFLSLFWLREVFNLTMSLFRGLTDGSYFGGDEARISRILELPLGIIPITLAVIGLMVALFVIFNVMPKERRFTFILSGLIGGISGYVLWMNILGPRIIP